MEVLNMIIDNELIFIILVIILLINFGAILYLVLKERKEDKKEIEELLNEIVPLEEKKEEIQDEKLETNKKEVEDMLLKMQQDLEASKEDTVTNFENEQEEKSIISYQELLNSIKEKQANVEKSIPVKIDIEEKEFDDDRTLRIDLNGENEIEESVLDEVIIPIEETKKVEEKSFKNTDFISPIFGIQDNVIKYPTVPKIKRENKVEEFEFDLPIINEIKKESIVDTTKLTEEIRKNDDFLRALKDFRKNLD